MDEWNDVTTLDFPSIPTPPGCHRVIRPGDTPGPVSSPLLFDSLPELPGWYPAMHTIDVRDGPTLTSPISPIACVSPGVSDICMSSSCSVVSDESDGDAGLLSALLGPPSFLLAQHQAGSPGLSSSSPWTFQLIVFRSDLRGMFHAGVWLGRARFAFRRGRFWVWLCLPQYYILIDGLCTTFWQIWTTFKPPPVLGVDRRSGFCSSAGSGPK